MEPGTTTFRRRCRGFDQRARAVNPTWAGGKPRALLAWQMSEQVGTGHARPQHHHSTARNWWISSRSASCPKCRITSWRSPLGVVQTKTRSLDGSGGHQFSGPAPAEWSAPCSTAPILRSAVSRLAALRRDARYRHGPRVQVITNTTAEYGRSAGGSFRHHHARVRKNCAAPPFYATGMMRSIRTYFLMRGLAIHPDAAHMAQPRGTARPERTFFFEVRGVAPGQGRTIVAESPAGPRNRNDVNSTVRPFIDLYPVQTDEVSGASGRYRGGHGPSRESIWAPT